MSDVDSELATEGLSPAEAWLSVNVQVVERAREPAKATGKAPVDAFISKPELAVEAVRSLVIQAVELDAPEGVVEELLPLLRPMVARLKERDLYKHSFDCLAQLEGLRDPVEFKPVLRAGVEGASDARNHAMLRGVFNEIEEPTRELGRIPCIMCGDLEVIASVDPHGCPICVVVFKALTCEISVESPPL